MKLPVHAWRTFWAYHAWAGVSVGLILHLMFVAGAVTLFLAPLRVWEEPLQHRPAAESLQISPQVLLERGRAAIADLPAPPKRLWLGVPQGESGVARFQYSDAKTGKWLGGWLDPQSGAFVPEREQVATFLYHLHYLWFATVPELEYLAGLLAVAFLLTVVTGVLIHLKDLRRQLYQFRPRSPRRTLWSDLHKVLGVMGLPFQILFCYTGALLVLGPVLLTAIGEPVFGEDRAAESEIIWNEPTKPLPKMGGPAPSKSLDEVLQIARQAMPGFSPMSFGVMGYGREHGLVRVYGSIDRAVSGHTAMPYAQILMDHTTGEVLHIDTPATDLPSHATRRWLSGLHYVYFGGAALRVVLALLALAGCATILTGNWIWLTRRAKEKAKARAKQEGGAGDSARARPPLLARLTAGLGAGVFVAVGTLFVASRLLPFDDVGRIATEQLLFAGALAACMGWAMIAEQSARVWWQLLGLAGLLFLAVPGLSARLSSAGLFGGGPKLATVVAVDAGLLLVGAAFVVLAWALRRRQLREAGAGADASGDDVRDDASDDGEQEGVAG